MAIPSLAELLPYTRQPPANFKPSAALIVLLRRRDKLARKLPKYRSDWDRMEIQKNNAKIRAQRIRDAVKRGTHTAAEWDCLVREFDFRCARCLCEVIGRPTKDHIIPICLGGSDLISNIQPLCRQCNSGKGDLYIDWVSFRRERCTQ